MARLPEPTLESITVMEPYEGVEQDREKFLDCFVKLLAEVIANEKEVG